METSLSAHEAGRRFRNNLIRCCLAADQVTSDLKGEIVRSIGLDWRLESKLVSFVTTRFFENILTANGQLARQHSAKLVCLEYCLGEGADMEASVIEFLDGMLFGSSDLYGCFLKEEVTDAIRGMAADREREIPTPYERLCLGVYGNSSNHPDVLDGIACLMGKSVNDLTPDDVSDTIYEVLTQMDQDEESEPFILSSNSNEHCWIHCAGSSNFYQAGYGGGDPFSSFKLGGSEPKSLEVVSLVITQYALGDMAWWHNNNWFRCY